MFKIKIVRIFVMKRSTSVNSMRLSALIDFEIDPENLRDVNLHIVAPVWSEPELSIDLL